MKTLLIAAALAALAVSGCSTEEMSTEGLSAEEFASEFAKEYEEEYGKSEEPGRSGEHNPNHPPDCGKYQPVWERGKWDCVVVDTKNDAGCGRSGCARPTDIDRK